MATNVSYAKGVVCGADQSMTSILTSLTPMAMKHVSGSIMSGWWLSYLSEKYEFVNWDDEIPNIWENKKRSNPNHQTDV